MNKHKARRRATGGRLRVVGRARSPRVRAVLALGLVLGLGSTGTMAYWTDSATVTAGAFSAGTLNLKVSGNEGNPTAWADTTFTASDLLPGESYAGDFAAQNTGTGPFTYTATATASNATLAAQMSFQVFVGGTASNTGTAAAANRAGTCAGTSQGTYTLTATAQTVISTAQNVAAGASQNVCVIAKLLPTAASAIQGQSTTASFVLNAKQLGAP